MKRLLIILPACLIFSHCKNEHKHIDHSHQLEKVDSTLFATENLVEPISIQDITLKDGSKKKFYKIVIKPEPQEHKAGPWCPKTITDSKENGGVWFNKGKLYDVDGKFIAGLDTFYKDPKWKMYKEDGTINVTETQEACEAAARPDVDEKYNNYCVECQPSFYSDVKNTYLIPVDPIYKTKPSQLSRGGIGIAFNGVKFDGPAPTHAILAAHTLAPLDDCGGHVNPHAGYHYHAVTGCGKKLKQEQHASLIGYAMDGFGIHAATDESGTEAIGLDECGGHKDEIRGYHYHAANPGANKIIGCFHGETAPREKRPPRPPRK